MLKFFFNDRNNIYLITTILISIIVDLIIINIQNNLTPAWDQGYHLSNAYKYSLLLKEINIFSKEWVTSFWSVTDSYRGPFTYIVSGIFMNIFGMSYKNAIISNHIFNSITVFSIYELGKTIKNEKLGVISGIIFSLSPIIINLRTDFLLDNSLCASITICWLYLTKIYFDNSFKNKQAFFLGILFGILFLIKPTSIIYFIVPLIIIIIKILKKNIFIINKLLLFLISILSFVVLISPWVSLNWLTILTSINNAWNWGINYQDGLDANSISGWTYYIKEILRIPGFYFGSILFSIGFVNLIQSKNKINLSIYFSRNQINKKLIWYLLFPLKIYVIGCLMSSKDIRFIVPIYPQICLFFGFILININFRKNINSYIYIFLLLILLINSFSFNLKNKELKFFSFYKKEDVKPFNYNMLHREIINSVAEVSPYTYKVVGMIPDLKSLNTFNLESEAIRQNSNVAIRQIISNDENFKMDLYNFDWFLLKSGYQGIMQSDARNKLDKKIRASESFEIFKQWELPKNEKLILMKRKKLSYDIKYKICNIKKPKVDIEISPNTLKTSIEGDINKLSDSLLFINFFDSNFSNLKIPKENIVLPKLNYAKDKNYGCAKINFFFDNPKTINVFPIQYFESILINKKVYKSPFKELIFNKDYDKQEYMFNRIKSVEDLGIFLKYGEFDKLFNLVSLLNQSDPKQNYLRHSERIYTYKYLITNKIENLYPIAISQILQKDAQNANKTIDKIVKYDKKNPNLYLAKSITEFYQFKFAESETSIKKAIKFNKKEDLKDTLNVVFLLNKLIQFKLWDLKI